jgi:toxin-antitoxin system PIN domain toxin
VSTALLDVNVLVALFDPAHLNHDEAHAWFGVSRSQGWATCPLTQNGCIRVLSSPAYPSVETVPEEVASRLAMLCGRKDHAFWADSVSLLDPSLFRLELIAGAQQITDVYLLGLAVRRNGRLVTFDKKIPQRAVVGAGPRHLELLGH